ncbi:contractile injection system protein, VgrG/Pvc8 family [Burkholderia cepacia]|uniref:contractile injection system protein, VgrG/Pvc8 family n=1 Tax=Burkholderia cepacia TaxID=292 RepID=UPI00158CE03A|nr:contractile injection system protein, VgrG/Pvc8 family [Burkholderia cepacia]UIY58660.1 phage late control D family protein [Burkholderia cepacia]
MTQRVAAGYGIVERTATMNAAPPMIVTPATIRYSTDEIFQDEQVVMSFVARRELTSGSTTLETNDYKAPGAQRLAAGVTGVNQGDVDDYEIYDYLGAHGFSDNDCGEQLARFRSEALATHSKYFSGVSDCWRSEPGRYVQIAIDQAQRACTCPNSAFKK